jgi:tight adherence protein C
MMLDLNPETWVPIAAFVAMTVGCWLILGYLADRPRSAEERLRRLIDPVAARSAAETSQTKRQEALQAKVTAAASKLGKSLRPSDQAELGKIRIRLLNAGFRQEQAVAVYYGIKVISLLVGLSIAFPPLFLRYGATQTTWVASALAAGVGFYLPGLVVDSKRKRRAESIFLGLPDALDLMVVCVEAGLGLDAAMRRVTAELSHSSAVLCEELAIANFQVQMGRPRKDVLRDLGTRTGVEDVRSLAAVIIQAEKFGSSIASALRVQSDAMRLRRRQLAEERAAKTSVKIMIPLIFFIFPGVFVVLVGPAGLRLVEMFSK